MSVGRACAGRHGSVSVLAGVLAPMGQDRPMATLRAMTEADIPGAATVFDEAFRGLAIEYSLPRSPRTEEGDLRFGNRVRYLMGSDPSGSWVAEEEGMVVGLSQSFVREGYWMLSLLAILPGHQGKGLGRGLLDLAV
jgi:ribosomal protein S18 acetylase RimI-like enzyme